MESRRNFSAKEKGRKAKILLGIFFAALFFGLVFILSMFFAYKFYATSKKVIQNNPPESFLQSIKDMASPRFLPLRGERDERINILLAGLAGENYPGENLTDSIIVASVNPETYETALLSIPRDLYVRIPNENSWTKINALYARGYDRRGKSAEGIEDLKKSVSEITGLPIHYYVALDFDGFKQIINELGGIKIQVAEDIRDERYPGPNYSYETFDIGKGLYTFDGEVALKYARTRHDEGGDFGRAYRQQQILESARQKAFALGTLVNLPAINNILTILGEHLRTDIRLDELESFLELSKKIDTHLTINYVLDAGKSESLLAVSHVTLGKVRAFVLIPRTGSYDEVKELAENIFELEAMERRKEEIKKEGATVAVLNRSGTAGFDEKLTALLGKMGYETKSASAKGKTAVYRSKRNVSPKTAIYDLSNIKPFSLDDLTKKFSADNSSDNPLALFPECANADLCLVAGSDLAERLAYDENTIEELEEGYDKQEVDEREYIELLKKGSNKKF